MKLLYCDHCHDIFSIGFDTLHSCECGRIKGWYLNNEEAEVSPEAISVVIGNRSLLQAIKDMQRHKAETGDMAERDEYRKLGYGAIDHAWVRPNSGPGNPRTRLIEAEIDEVLDKRYLRMPLPDRHNIRSELKGAT